jgi:putative ABC transport system permease protein
MKTNGFRFWIWLIALIGVIVPRRLRAHWRREWEAELRHREAMLADWDRLDWGAKLDLFRRSASAFWDALWLQPKRLEDEMFQDLRFGARMLLKNPGFTMVAIITLALGIGANTAIFSVINAVLLRSLPFNDAERLVMIWETHPAIPRVSAPIPDFQDWRAQAKSFEEMAVHSDRLRDAVLVGKGEPAQAQGSYISQNLFPMLGLKPALGRNFLPEEEQRDKNHVVILSQAIWRQSFAADPDIIGKNIRLNNESFTVVGVMGEQYPPNMDVWLPLSHLPADDFVNRSDHRVSVVGRLKPGMTMEQSRSEMETIAARLQQAYPASNKNIGVELLPMRDQLVGNLRPVVLLIFAAVGLILLIACSNVSNLLLAQAAGRQRELALRAALGAGRSRLARQLLLESLLLSLLGGMAGLALAKWSLPALRDGLSGIVTTKIPGLESIGIDQGTLAFTLGVSLLTGVLFGVLPALQFSRIDLNQVLKEGAKSSAGVGRRNLSRALVAAEVALAVVVLVGAGLLVRSFQRLLRVDPGFGADHMLGLQIKLPPTRYSNSQQINEFYQRLMPQLRSLSGIEQAAIIDRLPFAPSLAVDPFTTDGRFPEPGLDPLTQMRSVGHRFFETMRIPLRRGRFFNESEIASNPGRYVLINETMARRFFPDQDPLGKRIFLRSPNKQSIAFPIIGVVADIKDLGLDAEAEPETYFAGVGRESMLMLRTTVDPLSLASAVRKSVMSVDPELLLPQVHSVEEMLSTSFARRRIATTLLGLFALLALLLAATGIYGVIAYSVTQREQELGIRMALGAKPGDVLRLVIGRGMAPVLLGMVCGFAGAITVLSATSSLTAGLLFEVHAIDPATFAAIGLLLLGVALLACWLPARKATKVDPLAVIRHE